MKNRSIFLEPLPAGQWPAELEDIRRGLGEPLNVHGVMAHHPALTLAWMPFRNHVVAGGSLEPRHRELVILRTAFLCDADYEWRHHVLRGRRAGLSDEEIRRVKDDPSAAAWPPAERLLLQVTDECHRHNEIGEPTLRELGAHFDTRQQLDILATVGMYRTLATIIRTYRVPLEEEPAPAI